MGTCFLQVGLLLGPLPCWCEAAQFVSCCSATRLALKDQNFYIALYFFFFFPCVIKSINGLKKFGVVSPVLCVRVCKSFEAPSPLSLIIAYALGSVQSLHLWMQAQPSHDQAPCSRNRRRIPFAWRLFEKLPVCFASHPWSAAGEGLHSLLCPQGGFWSSTQRRVAEERRAGAAGRRGAARCFLQWNFPPLSALVPPVWQRTSWEEEGAVCGFLLLTLTGSLRAWGRQNGENGRLKMKTSMVCWALRSLPKGWKHCCVHLQCHFPEKQESGSSNSSKPHAQLHPDLLQGFPNCSLATGRASAWGGSSSGGPPTRGSAMRRCSAGLSGPWHQRCAEGRSPADGARSSLRAGLCYQSCAAQG